MTPDENGAYWRGQVAALLAQVDNIERHITGETPTTCQLRRVGLAVVKRARSDPHFRALLLRSVAFDKRDVSVVE